jgi:hypothetical protein
MCAAAASTKLESSLIRSQEEKYNIELGGDKRFRARKESLRLVHVWFISLRAESHVRNKITISRRSTFGERTPVYRLHYMMKINTDGTPGWMENVVGKKLSERNTISVAKVNTDAWFTLTCAATILNLNTLQKNARKIKFVLLEQEMVGIFRILGLGISIDLWDQRSCWPAGTWLLLFLFTLFFFSREEIALLAGARG